MNLVYDSEYFVIDDVVSLHIYVTVTGTMCTLYNNKGQNTV